MSLYLNFLMSFLWLDGGYWFWGGWPQRGKGHSRHIWKVHTIKYDVNFVHLPELVYVQILLYEVTHSPFSYSTLWKVVMRSPHIKSGELCSTCFMDNLFRILYRRIVSSCLFINSFISMWTYKYLVYILAIIRFYFIGYSNCSSFGCWELF